MSELVYPQYGWKPEYDNYPKTFGAFGIVPGTSEGLPAVLIKQRNGNGGSPYLFDLPGGGINQVADPDLAAACIREVKEEVGLDAVILAKIGNPLWMPIKKDGVIVRVDCAQAFLVEARGVPTTTDEALATAFVHAKSAGGYNIVSRTADPDPAKRVFGRTPVMIWDGLSVLQRPCYRGPVTEAFEAACSTPLLPSADEIHAYRHFYLVDGGNYFARPHWAEDGDGMSLHLELFYRLNPNEPDGRFHGALDNLVR